MAAPNGTDAEGTVSAPHFAGAAVAVSDFRA
jgi:hypothetical protein